jgi:hypothetical protein
MRGILLATLFSLGLTACSENFINPREFSCQPPQLAELSKQVERVQIGQVSIFASEPCVQNDLMANLSAAGPEATRPALEAPLHMLLNRQGIAPKAARADPKGIRCLLLEGQTYCAFDSYWVSRAPVQTHYNWDNWAHGMEG